LTRLRLAAAALNTTPLDWDNNLRHIRSVLAAARDMQAGILCLPELCITGYGCEDMFFSSGVQQTAMKRLVELAAETKGLVACFGLPVMFDGGIYNAVGVAGDGRLLGLVAKQHLAGDGIHYEPRWFRRWPCGEVGTVDVAGTQLPIGDLLFDAGGVRIGFEICRDAWVADRTGAVLAARGADVLLNPSASHFAFAKQQIRERIVLEGSRVFHVSYAYANLLGNEAGRSIYDGGTLIASGGEMLARGPRFSFGDWVLTSAVIDIDATRQARAAASQEVSSAAIDERSIIKTPIQFPETQVPADTPKIQVGNNLRQSEFRNPKSEIEYSRIPGDPVWETGPYQKEEEFARSVALGLFDYLRKSSTRGFVVSLSGGADSSAVATLVHVMVRLAGLELGPVGLLEKLRRTNLEAILGKTPLDSAEFSTSLSKDCVGALLTCVYQATANSGPITFDAAKTLAGAIGARFVHWNVDRMVNDYIATVAAAVGRKIDWEQDDLALQNIQARVRGPGAWMLANLAGALLLTTSNRSEAAVGYATMDGDTCGGLAPIAGIDKAYLLDWLRWMETTGPAGIGALPALSAVNAHRPTAELRPAAADQTDEGDLMPYRVLDAIERAAIRDKLLPVAAFSAVQPQFPEHSQHQIGEWVERFFQLWARNQWKRERYAPSFHLDDENLDPKTWCRFPILNSGFERELQELRQHVRLIDKGHALNRKERQVREGK
jgi:NAD+ synthase (glutamine-hydrolysing)